MEAVFGMNIENSIAQQVRNVAEETISKYRCPAPELVQITGPYWEKINAAAKGILKEEMQNLYTGTLYIIGNPAVRPHCTQAIYDPAAHISGPFTAGNVIHHLGIDSGFVTEIHPRCMANSWRPDWLQAMTLFLNSTGVRSAYDVFLSWSWANQIYTDSSKDPTKFLDSIIGGVEAPTNVNPFTTGRRGSLGAGFTVSGPPVNELRNTASPRYVADDRYIMNSLTSPDLNILAAITLGNGMGLGNIFTASQETIQAARGCYIAPLLKHSLPYVGGITGWAGSVIVNGQILMPSSADRGHGFIPIVSEAWYLGTGGGQYTLNE
jgi:hypothetical protein